MAIARALSASAAVALCGIAVLATVPARGQDYPARAIKLIVPLAPGGLADTLARIVSQRLADLGAALPLGSPDEFAFHIAAERKKWGDVIHQANIRLE
jgi:tripartite-type tricarboxylate transporter receptor subunit TctC